MLIVRPSAIAAVAATAVAAAVMLAAQPAAASPTTAQAPRVPAAPGAPNPQSPSLPPFKLPTQDEVVRFAHGAFQQSRQFLRYAGDQLNGVASAVARLVTDAYNRLPAPEPRQPVAGIAVCAWLAYQRENADECGACATIPVEYPPYYEPTAKERQQQPLRVLNYPGSSLLKPIPKEQRVPPERKPYNKGELFWIDKAEIKAHRDRLQCLYQKQCAYGPELCPSEEQPSPESSPTAGSNSRHPADGRRSGRQEYDWSSDGFTAPAQSPSEAPSSGLRGGGSSYGAGVSGVPPGTAVVVMHLRPDVWLPIQDILRKEEAYLARLQAKQIRDQYERERLGELARQHKKGKQPRQ